MATTITTAAGLAAMASDLDEDYILGGNIDLLDAAWTPIGSSSSPFTGSLDGAGFQISHITSNGTSGEFVGLFGYMRGATISDLKIGYATLLGDSYVGALAGYVQDSSIDNCCASNVAITLNVATADIGLTLAGGLIGQFEQVSGAYSISECSVSGTIGVSANDSANDVTKVGGLIGNITLTTSSGVSVLSCCADVDMTLDTAGGAFNGVGGLIGSATSASTNLPLAITDCFALGSMGFDGGNLIGVSGFLGKTDGAAATLDSCYSLVNITGVIEAPIGFGGFVGQIGNDLLVTTECFYRGLLLLTTTGGSLGTGGFLGQNVVGGTLTASKCFTEGSIVIISDLNGQDTGTGGFFGQCANGTCTDCYSAMDVGVTCGSSTGTGGFAGRAFFASFPISRFTNCYYSGDLVFTKAA